MNTKWMQNGWQSGPKELKNGSGEARSSHKTDEMERNTRTTEARKANKQRPQAATASGDGKRQQTATTNSHTCERALRGGKAALAQNHFGRSGEPNQQQ